MSDTDIALQLFHRLVYIGKQLERAQATEPKDDEDISYWATRKQIVEAAVEKLYGFDRFRKYQEEHKPTERNHIYELP